MLNRIVTGPAAERWPPEEPGVPPLPRKVSRCPEWSRRPGPVDVAERAQLVGAAPSQACAAARHRHSSHGPLAEPRRPAEQRRGG